MKRLLAYSQLLRIPNVFTAMADIFMGFLISHGSLEPWMCFVPLLLASSCIYLAGMVLNDWFDIEVDRRERPERPLPSGRVPPAHALVLGIALLGAGVLAALAAAALGRTATPAYVAVLLASSVLAYDGLLKATVVGPWVMGLCRALNVLLGMSDVPGAIWLPLGRPDWPPAWRIGTMAAAGLGLYIVGVTRFARSEATPGPRPTMLSTTLGFNLGLVLIAMIPQTLAGSGGRVAGPGDPYWVQSWADPWEPAEDAARGTSTRYYAAALIWAGVAVVTNGFVWRALADPGPRTGQQAVKACILAIIGLDAAVVAFVNGPGWAAAVLALLAPTLALGRWVYST